MFITKVCFWTYSTARLIIIPIITPIIPPINVILADSIKNCCLISAGDAPKAFRKHFLFRFPTLIISKNTLYIA